MPTIKRPNNPSPKSRGGPKAGRAARDPMIDPRMVDAAIGPGADTMTVRERVEALWRRVLGAPRDGGTSVRAHRE